MVAVMTRRFGRPFAVERSRRTTAQRWRWRATSASLEPSKQLPRRDAECFRDLHDVDDGGVSFAPFNHANVVVIHPGRVGESPLRQAALGPQLAESLSKSGEKLIAPHLRPCIWGLRDGSPLHTMSSHVNKYASPRAAETHSDSFSPPSRVVRTPRGGATPRHASAELIREAKDDRQDEYRLDGAWRFTWRQLAYIAMRRWTLAEICDALGRDAAKVLPPLLAL